MESGHSRVSVPALQSVLDRLAFTREMRVRVEAAETDACTLKFPFRAELERPGGVLAGHVYMAAADLAFWLAIMTRIGTGTNAVTSHLTSSFLKPARKEPVWCSARVLRLGRTQAYGVAECHNGNGGTFTHHTVSYALDPR